MRTTCLRFVLPVILLIGSSVRAAAQDVPTVFIHGLASSNATWQGAADRLKARVAIAPQRPNLNWRDKFESQASSLQSALGGLPGSTIAVGHSNGGLVARQWSRLHPVGGIVTLGTPNQGAPLAYNALRWLNYNFTVSHVITEVFNAYSRNCCTWNGTLPQVQNWIYYVRYWLGLEATGLASTIGIDTTAPVLAQMASGSPAGLNSSANLSREASAVPARVGIGIVAHNFYYAGPFRAMWPEDGDTIATWMSTTVNTLNYFAAYIAATADPADSGAADLVSWLTSAASYIASIDPTWCRYVSSASANVCNPNDTVIPDWSQAYPGAPLIYVSREGPTHTRETSKSDDWLYLALTNFMHVKVRSSSSPAPPSSGGNTLASSRWLDPGRDAHVLGRTLPAGVSRRRQSGPLQVGRGGALVQQDRRHRRRHGGHAGRRQFRHLQRRRHSPVVQQDGGKRRCGAQAAERWKRGDLQHERRWALGNWNMLLLGGRRLVAIALAAASIGPGQRSDRGRSAAAQDSPMSVLWRVPGEGRGVPAADDTTAYFLSARHEVVAIDRRNGSIRWRRETGEPADSTLGSSVTLAGSIVVAGDYDVYGFDRSTGAARWRFSPADGYGPGI